MCLTELKFSIHVSKEPKFVTNNRVELKGILQDLLTRSTFNLENCLIIMIVILGILMCPAKDSAERSLVFSSIGFVVVVVVVVCLFVCFLAFWGSQINQIGP